MSAQQPTDTLYIGNVDQKVSRRLLYEICIQVYCLFKGKPCRGSDPWTGLALKTVDVQAGPVVRLELPEDPAGGHRGFGFCQYEDVVNILSHPEALLYVAMCSRCIYIGSSHLLLSIVSRCNNRQAG